MEASLREIITQANDLPWDHHLYVPRIMSLNANTPVIVLNDDDEIERTDNDEPEFAASKGMKYLLGISTVQDVVSNIKKQIENPGAEQIVNALVYYIENDAFINHGENR